VPPPAPARAAPRRERFDSRFNDSDTVVWNIERDPSLRTTIVAIALLDRAPDWNRLRERILATSLSVPRLRQKVVPNPLGWGRPRWERDDDFDLDYHLRRVVVPPPGDLGAVLELAAPIAMAAFDKARPLWEFTLVEGLSGGRAALIEKLHHAFTDGVGGVRLAEAFVDDQREPRRRRGTARDVPPPAARPGGLLAGLVDAARDGAREVTTAAARSAELVAEMSLAAWRDPVALTAGTARGVRSVGRLLRPAREPGSPIMRHRGLSRQLRAFDVPLEELRRAAHTVDGTLNDAFLAAIAGGVREYHRCHRAAIDHVRVTMPVNLRTADDSLGNNRFTPVRFKLPISAVEPQERMRRLGELARRWRAEPALPASNVIAGALNRLPVAATTAIFGSMLKAIDLVATNVPGIERPVYLAGARVLRHYAFPPPSGASLGIALLSHEDVACIGITIDTAAVPDPDVLAECLEHGFADVLAVSPPATRRAKRPASIAG
jgi:WS/DGAT/MGAT family acyltransferase